MSEETITLDIHHRIRHIRQIFARRISTNEIPTLFFRLHTISQPHTLLHTSEKHPSSRNPTWKKITFQDTLGNLGSDSQFILRIWAGDKSKEKFLLEWVVDLNELVGVEEHRVGVLTSPNLILFSLSNASKGSLLFTDKSMVEGLKVITYEIDLPPIPDISNSVRVTNTYTLPTLQTLIQLDGAVNTEKRRMKSICHRIQSRLQTQRSAHEKSQNIKYNIKQLKKRNIELGLLVDKRRGELRDISEKVQIHETEVHQNIEDLKSNQQMLQERKERHTTRKSHLLHQLNSITHRRLSLIKDLGDIYEIVIPAAPPSELLKEESAQDIFLPTVLGVPLPRQSTINHTYIPDIRINTSLGFVVHVVSLLELILRLPLRFPVIFYGSQSLIINESSLSGEDFHEAPLFFKRKGDLSINKLEHALFLLNHDIIQVRQHLGLATQDFKSTLKNLKSLFSETQFCMKRLVESRMIQNEQVFRQENPEVDLIMFTEVNYQEDVLLPEIPNGNQS